MEFEELKEKYIKLTKEYHELYITLEELDRFFRKSGNNYNRKESLEALKIIREYRNQKYKEFEKLEKEKRDAMFAFQKSCNHEIVIKSPHNRKCACCGGHVFNDEYNPTYEIEIPFDTNLVGYEALMDDKEEYVVDYIYDAVDKYRLKQDELEESFEYLQDNSKAIVRKLK